MGSIYKITCIPSGKAYIGKTIYDAEKTRINKHLNGHGNRILKRAVKKYGKDAFAIEILHDCIIPELLDMLEIEAIAKHNTLAPNGYNLTAGGEGHALSDETRQKRSEMSKGKNNHFYGKKHSAQSLKKMSEAKKGKKNYLYGKNRSAEICRKISESNKGRKAPNLGKRHSSYLSAKKLFFSLPADMTLTEKRKKLREAFPEVCKYTIYYWVKHVWI